MIVSDMALAPPGGGFTEAACSCSRSSARRLALQHARPHSCSTVPDAAPSAQDLGWRLGLALLPRVGGSRASARPGRRKGVACRGVVRGGLTHFARVARIRLLWPRRGRGQSRTIRPLRPQRSRKPSRALPARREVLCLDASSAVRPRAGAIVSARRQRRGAACVRTGAPIEAVDLRAAAPSNHCVRDWGQRRAARHVVGCHLSHTLAKW